MSKEFKNKLDNKNDLSFYQNELAKKNKQIKILQHKINNLILNKNSLISHIDKYAKTSIHSQKNISPQNNFYHNKLFSSVQSFAHKNFFYKNKIFSDNMIEDKYSNTLQYKLISTQREIENLTIMNTNKDNIIMNMQNFINALNIMVCNGKINLDLNQIDIKTFIINLKKLEQKIIEKLQKIKKPNKIPDSIIKKIKQDSIRKQKTEVSLVKKKNLYIIPFANSINNISSKLNTQSNINKSRFSNNSLNKKNFTCKKGTRNKCNDCKDLESLTAYKSIQYKKNIKDKNSWKLKHFFLTKQEELCTTPPVKNINSLENSHTNEYYGIKSNEMTINRILSDNGNGIYFKKINK